MSNTLTTDRMTELAIFDIDLELDVLSTLAFVPDLQYRITQLTEDDFYNADNKKLYNTFLDMFKANNLIDPALIGDRHLMLKITNRNSTSISANFSARIGKLKEISGRRKIQRIAYKLTAMASSGKSLSELRQYGSRLTQIGEDTAEEMTTKIIDERLEEYLSRQNPGSVKSGYGKLDRTTGGFMEGSLNIIASAQGIGKTTFVLNMLPSICEKQGKKVLFVSLEMTFMALHAKLVSLLSGVPFSKMMYDMQTLTTDEWISINNARARAYGYHIYRMGETQVSTIDIRAKLKALKDVDIVILDYLQLVRPTIKSTSMYEIITNISRELKMIAAEANIPFIVIASINRDYSDRGDYRPHISDIRGSGNIEYDADMVLLLHRDSAFREYNPSKDADEYAFNHSADITVAKNRFGEANLRIDLFFDGAKSIMRESHEESTRPYKARADTGA
jgi:replicative DNA helicase